MRAPALTIFFAPEEKLGIIKQVWARGVKMTLALQTQAVLGRHAKKI